MIETERERANTERVFGCRLTERKNVCEIEIESVATRERDRKKVCVCLCVRESVHVHGIFRETDKEKVCLYEWDRKREERKIERGYESV